MATGEDDVLAGIAVDETGLVPCRRKLAQEVHLKLRQLGEVVGLHGHTLDAGLHDDA